MITPQMTFSEIFEKYPMAKDFLRHYGALLYIKKRHLMHEPLSSCAKTFSINPENLVEELNSFLNANKHYRPRKNPIKDFQVVWFAMIMSTGIVSIASMLVANLYEKAIISYTLLGFAQALFWLNVISYPTMVIMKLSRCIAFWKDVVAELSNPRTSLVFFAIVAGTNVMGVQLVMFGHQEIAKVFWYLGLFLWAIISMGSFGFLFIGEKRPIQETMHGGWLLATVGTESVAVLGALIAPYYQSYGDVVILISYIWWLAGGFLYIIIATLLMHRLIFFKLDPQEFVPTYWINMGAIATATLAGASLVLSGMRMPSGLEAELLSFTRGFTFFFWAFSTWWIPILLVLKAWKYIFHRTRPVFNAEYWGMVYPLGMYTACTYQLSHVLDLHLLLSISKYFWFVAITAWISTFIWTWVFILKPVKPRYPKPPRVKFLIRG